MADELIKLISYRISQLYPFTHVVMQSNLSNRHDVYIHGVEKIILIRDADKVSIIHPSRNLLIDISDPNLLDIIISFIDTFLVTYYN